jgi:N-carbamoylputrescine amidase
VNRVGREDKLTFWGQSFICNPFGIVLGQSGKESQVLIAECSMPEIESTRQNWPFLRDRRVDSYQDISKLYIDKNE